MSDPTDAGPEPRTPSPPAGEEIVVPGLAAARWWTIRRAQSRKPSNYICPFCGQPLPALSEHLLITPEGSVHHRRHAHTDCVLAARHEGALTTLDEWRAIHPTRPGLLGRLLGRS